MPCRGLKQYVQVGDDLADDAIALRESLRELRGLGEDVVDRAALPLEDGDQ